MLAVHIFLIVKYSTMIANLPFGIFVIFCVGLSQEKAPCPPNEHHTTCVNACPTPICSDPRPASCNFLLCNPGCECNEGFVRIKKPNGTCIPMDKCVNCLKPEYEFQEYGRRCNTTCGPYVPDFCVFGTPGCYCKTPKVYDNLKKECVTRDNCSY